MPRPRKSAAQRKPRYIELADEMLASIRSGAYPIGSLLPTEREFCITHKVSRHTARAAIALVSAQGLVARRPGAGTRVIASGEPMRYQHEVDSIETLLQYGRMTRLEITESARARVPAELAAMMGLPAGSEVIRLQGLRFGEPRHDAICTTEILIPMRPRLPTRQLLDLKTAGRTVFDVVDLRRIGHVEQIFDAAKLSEREAKALGTKAGSPALRVFRRYDDAKGQPIAIAVSLHPAGRFSYRMELHRRRHMPLG
jgi:DNA-binding GntR family transcriptional regulator